MREYSTVAGGSSNIARSRSYFSLADRKKIRYFDPHGISMLYSREVLSPWYRIRVAARSSRLRFEGTEAKG